ncbi:LysR substrate-binding domain-containing protein [Erwinia tasmaniensis]|uniref:Transcriptional regulator protein, LysR family n=1 Tax=Erwinia tasmaniensis (strain DSM 17950 / CFBP 7177 / CIP 109463 / NCPPB 4357 / Et1/99) TaxID=465817 RepID=B2VD63_ERWT9|nr:LysR substrate-binding domain-containing protein [Erwinia tasmaniensis]CAO95851.1 Putative transcriptional regulator protein, LysR family [Erwinia tasmaniensis Et1/99]
MTPSRPVTFDLDALRSFVLGMELGSFALAARRLNRSTSAVSAQLKKLEQQSGLPLLHKAGRRLELTENGELLMAYGRRLLALNDEAFSTMAGRNIAGSVRIGLQEDFGEALLSEVLGQFSRAHPQVQVSVSIGGNAQLLQGIHQGELDLALCWQGELNTRFMQPLPAATLGWIGCEEMRPERWLAQGEPLPLLLFDAPCLIRMRAIDALDNAAIPWRVAFTSRSLSGIWAAATAGLGVTLRSELGLPAGLQILHHPLLPKVAELGIALHQGQEIIAPAAGRLREILLAQLVPRLSKMAAT